MDRYVLIERDGGITPRMDEGITELKQVLILPYVQEALLYLEQRDIKAVVLSDQSAVVPSKIDHGTLDEIHGKMLAIAAESGGRIEDVIFCPSGSLTAEEGALPQPGLIHAAEQKYGFDLSETFFVASSLEGLHAGWAAGCKTAFVKTGKPYKAMQHIRISTLLPDIIAPDLLTAVLKIFPE